MWALSEIKHAYFGFRLLSAKIAHIQVIMDVAMPKKRKKKLSPIEKLTPSVLPSVLEFELRQLYELACQNSKPLWPRIDPYQEELPDESLIEDFFRLTHLGMRKAQESMLDRLLCQDESDELSSVRYFAYRGVADAIAWQLLGSELAYAKRFFMAKPSPSLYESNIQSVISAAEKLHSTYSDSIALITDLTSFIQVGDILLRQPNKGISIYEVKEGKVNQEILGLLNQGQSAEEQFSSNEVLKSKPEKFRKQFERALRQKMRMENVSETLLKDEGTDAATGRHVVLPTPSSYIGSWYPKLLEAYDRCMERGWGIALVQDCFYIGCYEAGKFSRPGQMAFEVWFSSQAATEDCPRMSLIACMTDPIALPIYSLPIPDEFKFDLLFGRKHVSLGLNVPELVRLAQLHGINVRFASKKETTQALQRNGNFLWRYQGKAIYILKNGDKIFLGEGFTLRVFFHGEKPIDTLRAFSCS